MKKVSRNYATRRQRKNKSQKQELWDLFKSLGGNKPHPSQIEHLAEKLKLSEQQIYKWFWDTKKKVEEDEEYAKKIGEDEKKV